MPMDGDSAITPETAVKPISSGAEYIETLRGRGLKVYLFGDLVDEPVDHPMIRPSITEMPWASADANASSGNPAVPLSKDFRSTPGDDSIAAAMESLDSSTESISSL